MKQAAAGDTVKVHYTGTLKSGAEFDSSRGREPLKFRLGEGKVIPGFEDAITGLKPGECKTVEIPSDRAYGSYSTELVWQVDRKNIPADIELTEGMMLESVQSDGRRIPVRVTEILDTSVTVDANHPLAGEDLTFEVELVEIV